MSAQLLNRAVKVTAFCYAKRMSPTLSLFRLFRISRPRFWLYEVGTYAVGIAAALAHASAAPSLVTLLLLAIFFVYFLFPANLFIYGVNDIYDYETDRLNPKKVAYETLVMPEEQSSIMFIILLVNLPFVVAATVLALAGLTSWGATAAFIVFLFCAWQYSATPIRAKARPIFDSLFSAGHYVATGVFAYLLAGGVELSWLLVGAGLAWAVAMHAYSAVPDIAADTESGIATIATKLGRDGTIILCLGLYLSAGILATTYLGFVALLLSLVYVVLMLLSLKARTNEALFTWYAKFPYINAAAGMIIFFAAALSIR